MTLDSWRSCRRRRRRGSSLRGPGESARDFRAAASRTREGRAGQRRGVPARSPDRRRERRRRPDRGTAATRHFLSHHLALTRPVPLGTMARFTASMRDTEVAMRTIVIVSLMVIAAGGCRRDGKAPKPGDVVNRPQNPPVAYIADDDPRLREASRQAQESLVSFVQKLEGPHDQHINFAVKTALHEEGARSEGVWLTWLRFDGKSFHGTVSNEPVHL